MTVERRSGRVGRGMPGVESKWIPCHNGCRRKGVKIDATHRVTMLGHDTFVCSTCATAWQEIYEGALCSA
jgi:hypothetical protein